MNPPWASMAVESLRLMCPSQLIFINFGWVLIIAGLRDLPGTFNKFPDFFVRAFKIVVWYYKGLYFDYVLHVIVQLEPGEHDYGDCFLR